MGCIRHLTGFHLKAIAMVSMFIDHLAASVLLTLLNSAYALVTNGQAPTGLLLWVVKHYGTLVNLYDLMRIIGRFAFPLYVFLLVEGFTHTRSVSKYALRLAMFALLSEVPFDLALNEGILFFWTYNNVFFTLLTGLLCMWASKLAASWLQQKGLPGFLSLLATAAVTGLGCLLAEYVLRSDYGAIGVLAVMIVYLLRNLPELGFSVCVIALGLHQSIEFYALPMVLPIACYNGQRGRPSKFGPYIFYPAHLLLFYGITLLLT
jgi:hypothetical protein